MASDDGEQSSLVPAAAPTPPGSLRITDFPNGLQGLLRELDDSGDGILDMDELTDMCTVYVDMKRAAADGSIAISSLPKEIQPTLACASPWALCAAPVLHHHLCSRSCPPCHCLR